MKKDVFSSGPYRIDSARCLDTISDYRSFIGRVQLNIIRLAADNVQPLAIVMPPKT